MASKSHHLLHNPLADDLNFILAHTEHLWGELRGKRLFITGGTGFFGCWFLESFVWANDQLGLNASALVLTRDFRGLEKKAPNLTTHPAIHFHPGDIKNFNFPSGEFPYIIHAAATSAAATFNGEDPLAKFDNVIGGTRHVLDFAVHCRAQKFLLTSSAAVYGRQPLSISHVPEDYRGAPDPTDLNSVWGESKRAAEFLCAYYAQKNRIEGKIARCFSFVGPYLQLNLHYAIGNFIRDALEGGPIRVNGDGRPRRSYLYAADLAIWLWTILFKGEAGCVYNVGSEEEVTIAQLARMVAETAAEEPLKVHVAKKVDPNSPPERYVPCTQRAQRDLKLKQRVDLRTAIDRTLRWNIFQRNLKPVKGE